MAVSTHKKVWWTFDSANSTMRVDEKSINADLEKRFAFELVVYTSKV